MMNFSEKYQETMNQLFGKLYYFEKSYEDYRRKNGVTEDLKDECNRINKMFNEDVPKAIEIRRSDHNIEVMETRIISLLQNVITNMDNFIQKYGEPSEDEIPQDVKELLRPKRAADYDEDFTLHDEYNRPLAKPICDEKFLGEVKVSTTEYLDVFEERGQALTTKLPSEIELCNRSNSYEQDDYLIG